MRYVASRSERTARAADVSTTTDLKICKTFQEDRSQLTKYLKHIDDTSKTLEAPVGYHVLTD